MEVTEDGDLVRPAHRIRGPFSRSRFGFVPVGVSMTHQSHAASCDVNKIVERYARTGDLPPARFEPSYADVTGLQGDLTEMASRARLTIDKAGAFLSTYKPKAEPETPPAAPPAAPATATAPQ